MLSDNYPDEPPVIGNDVLTLEDIKRLRNLGIQDLYFFSRGILRYKHLSPAVHRDLCDFLLGYTRDADNNIQALTEDPLRKLVLMPRSHFKTTVATIADSLREVCKDPNIRILIGNESGANAESMLSEIKDHITNNPIFRAVYGYVIPKNINETTWSRNQILLPRELIAREPTISTSGTGAAVVSRHFNLLKFDDLIGEEALHSPSVMTKAITWLNHSLSLLITPATDRVHLVGTRWAYNDLYAHAIKNMGFKVFRRKAVVINANGEIEPLFSSRFSMEFFASIIESDPQQWAAQYANDPADTLFADFKKEWLRYYTLAPDGNIRYTGYDGSTNIVEFSKLRIYVHIDPSMGETLTADSSAVMVVGVDSMGQAFVLEAWEQRIDPINLTEKMFEVHERYGPKLISVESTAFQKALRYFVEREAKRRGTYLRVEDYKPSNKKSKEARIRGALQPYFSSGMVFVRPTQTHFVEQYLAFGRTDQDHMMDALAQGPHYWKAPQDDAALERHARIRDALLITPRRGLGGYGL